MGGQGDAGLWIQNMNAHPSVIPPPDTHLGLDRENGRGHCTLFDLSRSTHEAVYTVRSYR